MPCGWNVLKFTGIAATCRHCVPRVSFLTRSLTTAPALAGCASAPVLAVNAMAPTIIDNLAILLVIVISRVASLRHAADFLVPALEQPLALCGGAIFREIVADELDLSRLRPQRRKRRGGVRPAV